MTFLLGALLGYGMAWLTFGDEARFWQSRADYWYENSTQWMRSWFRDVYEPSRALPEETRHGE